MKRKRIENDGMQKNAMDFRRRQWNSDDEVPVCSVNNKKSHKSRSMLAWAPITRVERNETTTN